VGGSGAGKTWLASQIERALRGKASRLSLDDFYRDRSHLSPARRAQLNFDHPRSIDWPAFERVLRDCLAGRTAQVPRYDFAAHVRIGGKTALKPRPLVLVDGLWLLRRPALRRLFELRIFINCSKRTRLRRRLGRDRLSRGRSRASVLRQFRETVEPMHIRYVAPQMRWATSVVGERWGGAEVARLAADLKRCLNRSCAR
jgi:uridine kinase